MRHLAASPSRSDPQPWALEMCAGCWRYTELEVYQLSCCCSCRRCDHDDQRHLVAVAWICDHCDHVVDTVGVFTRWATALDARRRTLKRRRNFAVARHLAHVHHECRRHVHNGWRLTGGELKDALREGPSWIAFAHENGTVYHTYT